MHAALKGIISIDTLPKKLKRTKFLIINLSLCGNVGTHWIILSRDISGSYEIFGTLLLQIFTCSDSFRYQKFFTAHLLNKDIAIKQVEICKLHTLDSLEVNESKEELLRKYIPESFSIVYNVKQFQPKTSSSCGLFSIYYLIHKFYNNDSCLQEILAKIFSDDIEQNEKRVLEFLR